MEDDLKAIKKGQSPSGVELQKVPTTSPLEAPKPPTAPSTLAPSRPDMRVELGKTEKAKPLESSKSAPIPTPAPVPPPQKTVTLPAASPSGSLAVPPSGSSRSPKKLLLVVAIVLVVAGLGWLGYSLFGDQFSSTPTPTPVVVAPTPTPTPTNPVDGIFGVNLISLVVSTNSDPYSSLKSSIAGQTVDIGRILFYKITDETSNRYSFPAVLARFVIPHPQGLDATDQSGQMIFSLYGALNSTKNISIIVPLPANAQYLPGQEPTTLMTEWEKTMAKDLASMFGLDAKKQVGKTFLDNTYHGVNIRYLNFPNPDSTIDYSLVTTPSGLIFLVISNSRSHIYSIIDQILGY